MDAKREKRLDELLDKGDIHDRLMRYARGIDRNDGELCGDTFWPDALVDHGHSKFKGDTVGELFATVSKHNAHRQVHQITNLVIELNGDLATSEAQHWYTAETERNGVAYLLSRSLRYVDRWEKRNDEWRIFHRTTIESWNRVDPVVERIPNSENVYLCKDDKSDLSYHLFELTRKREKPPLQYPDADKNYLSASTRYDSAGFRLRDESRNK
ncbi:nuclear transport factor 2 family protein [Flavisphingomonas formosensis]|uniref:nuclear transport factor 2 family protein n=1 Tax=Flavisphingomonas formosensis TaxID=861534 RepID=UPI0012FA09F1|nr:nuclear transport factor 2 family protein [Sphingomonas formosensis]